MKIAGLAAAAALSACLAACGTGPGSTVPDPAALTALRDGRATGLALAFDGGSHCPMAGIVVVNVATGARHAIVTNWADYGPSRPGLVSVQPGRYRIAGGVCVAQGNIRLPALGAWFGEVEVPAGEVTYLGVLEARLVQRDLRSRFDDPVTRFLLEEGGETLAFFLEYRIVNDPAVRVQLTEIDPGLAGRLTHRSPPQLITNAQFHGYLDEAFSPLEDGSLPNRTEAMARLRQVLEREFGPLPSEDEDKPDRTPPTLVPATPPPPVVTT